jgi:hypothetical protein
MRGSTIVVACDPAGIFLEGIITDTSVPGTCMEIDPTFEHQPLVGGRHHWRHYQPAADGQQRQIAILREDDMQGILYNTPYVANTRCFMYVPALGEEMNVRVAGQPGTGSANEYDPGDRLTPQAATGMFILQSTSATWAPFKVMEEITVTPDVTGLVWAIRDS